MMSTINAYKISAIILLITMFMAVNCETNAQNLIKPTDVDTNGELLYNQNNG